MLIPVGPYAQKPPIVLAKVLALLGSGRSNHIRIHSRKISKAHVLILANHGRAFIRDLASRTGIRINGVSTRERFLENGDTIQIGDVGFIFKASPDAIRPPSPEASSFIGLNPSWGRDSLHFRCKSVLVGRRSTCDLHIDHDTVSTAHAVLFEHEGTWSVRDLGSRHGTYVNGHRVERQSAVQSGDVLRLGDVEVAVSAASSARSASAVAPSVGTQPRVLPPHPFNDNPDSHSTEIDVEWTGSESGPDSASDLEFPSAEDPLSDSQSAPGHPPASPVHFQADRPESISLPGLDEQVPVATRQGEGAEAPDPADPQKEENSFVLNAPPPVHQTATPPQPPYAELPAARRPSTDALIPTSDGAAEPDGPAVTLMKMSMADLQKHLLEPPQDDRRRRRHRMIAATIVVTFLLLAALAFVGWFKFGSS